MTCPRNNSAGRSAPAKWAGQSAWIELTAEQKQFQPIKMAIHAAMIHRMDTEIGRVVEHSKRSALSRTP